MEPHSRNRVMFIQLMVRIGLYTNEYTMLRTTVALREVREHLPKILRDYVSIVRLNRLIL